MGGTDDPAELQSGLRPLRARTARSMPDGRIPERGINRAHGYLTPFTLDSGAELLAVPEGLLDVAALAEP